MRFVAPKLATKLPPERVLSEGEFKQLREEAQALRAALDVYAQRVERLTEDDFRVRVR